jgi:energy-converting hydrogenase Eha subunit B
MTARKIIGILVALVGILIGAILSGTMLLILFAYWGAPENPGSEGNIVLGLSAALGALIGFGIYKLGRKIAG